MKISGETIELHPIPEGRWAGSKIAEVFPADGDTKMSCGLHEIFASETVAENPPIDDILYILEGEMEIESDGRVETFRAGDFAYLPAGGRRKFIVRDRVKHIYVTYPRDWKEESSAKS